MDSKAALGAIPAKAADRASASQRLEAFAFVVYATLLIYLSFVPFDLTLTRKFVQGERWFLGLRTVHLSLPDVVANLAMYFPVGAMLFHLLRQKGSSRAFAAFLATTGSVVFSLAIEHGQRWFPSRVPSWVDISSNLAGAIAGICLVWFGEDGLRRWTRRVRDMAAQRPGRVACNAFIIFVLAVQLRPFDPVVDPHHTAAAALRRADPRPWARWNALEETTKGRHPGKPAVAAAELARSRWEYGLDRWIDVALYAAVAGLFIVGRRSRAFASAGVVTVGLAAFVTGVRVFLISHGLDTAELICGFVGWPIGCLIGSAWVRRNNNADLEGTPTRIGPPPMAWQRGLALACITVVLLYELVPFDFHAIRWTNLLKGTDVCLIPFAAHSRNRLNHALYDLSGDFLRYAVLGASLWTLMSRRNRERGPITNCVLISAAAAGFMELLHLWMPSRFSDVTTLIMAAAASFVGVAALQWVRDAYTAMTTVVVEDLLTSQLIEGETYEPLPVTPSGRPRVDTSQSDRAQSAPPH